LSTFPLAACGGGGEDAPAPDPAPTAADAATQEAPEDTQETSDEAEEEASEESEDSADGPAAEDAVIPAEAVTDPPQEIGEFSLMEGSGPAHMYSHDEEIGRAHV